jgi:hypothetical protein
MTAVNVAGEELADVIRGYAGLRECLAVRRCPYPYGY